jgi:O-antigen/teichoic acid export membrane protein
LLLSFFLFFFFACGLDIQAYPLALFAALLLSVVFSFVLLRDKLQADEEKFTFEPQVLRQGVWVQSGHAVQFLNYRINFFIVVFLLDEAALGVYNNVVIIAESVWILGHSMGQMQHMKILNTPDEKAHIILTNKFMKINFAGTLVLMSALLLLPGHFWAWLFSDDFNDMGKLFIYLAPGILCFSISNIINHFLHARNRFRDILLSNVNGLVAGLLLSLVLIPDYGLKGACISWSCGLLTSMLTYIVIYKRILKTI